ncbi:MAG: hypothetical protein AB7R55_15590, partial [Gemmatimonadales bacterium]
QAVGLLPTVWDNEAGGAIVGLRLRSNYLGRFGKGLAEWSYSTEKVEGAERRDSHWYGRLENPTWLRIPRTDVGVEAFDVEGRIGASVWFDHQRKNHFNFGPTTHFGGSVRWVATNDLSYLDPLLYDDAGTVESEWYLESAERWGRWTVSGRLALAGGVEYRNRGVGTATDDRYDAQGYFRGSILATARRPLDRRSNLSLRVFGGIVEADHDVVRQRWFGVAGAGPYDQLRNPLVRSRDALLTGDVHFQQPGDGNVRGLDPTLLVPRLAAGTIEVDRSVVRRPRKAIAREVRVAVFGDLAWTDGFFSTRSTSDVAADAGIGLRLRHRIGETDFTTRLDLPLVVSHPDRGQGGREPFALRWVFGIER